MPSEVLQRMLNLATAMQNLPESLVSKWANAYGRDGPPVCFYV